jgi:penicillin-binding protein 1A
MNHFVQSIWNDKSRRTVYLVTLILVFGVLVSSLVLRYILSGLPSIAQLEEYTPSLTTRVYDVNNELIAELSVEKRALLPLDEIPKNIQNAVLDMEDNDFFDHWGISPKGMIRAFLRDILHRKVAQGGSTITQQLAKLIYLTPEKKVIRKIREIILAIQIERKFSKQEILQLYLNQIYLGENVYGVQSAAKLYFGKEVSQLTLGECAMITGLIPAPARFSPFNHPELAKQRRSIVLAKMLERGSITKEQKEEAEKEPIPEEKQEYTGYKAPYFVEYIRQELEPKYGTNTLWKGGLEIYTTLDLKMQAAAEDAMKKHLEKLDEKVEKHLENVEDNEFTVAGSTETKKLQAAFYAQDLKTGAIRVMIGGRDYDESKFNRVIQAKRQPGSTFKPFVWMAALQNGYTPATIVEDSPRAYYFDGQNWRFFEGAKNQYEVDLSTQPFIGNKDFRIWVPSNFDGKFLGKITLRRGLELSRNLVAVRLIDDIGPTVVIEVARKAGITEPLAPVPALALGVSAVPLMEITNALSTFGNGGIKTKPYGVIKVLDKDGKVLEENFPIETEAFKPQYAFLIANMMRGVAEHGTGVGTSWLNRPRIGKTGTSQDHRDVWFIGMTPDISAGAWIGYDDFSSLDSMYWTGGGTAVPLWTESMYGMLKGTPVHEFPVPSNITFALIDPDSGKLALPSCKKKFTEAFISGTEPKTFCNLNHTY